VGLGVEGWGQGVGGLRVGGWGWWVGGWGVGAGGCGLGCGGWGFAPIKSSNPRHFLRVFRVELTLLVDVKVK
jgi:hypothetical protein